MPQSPDCPGPESWQALLADDLPSDERDRCMHHLEVCPACQERLDRLPEWGGDLLARARQVGDATAAPADPTLVKVMERLLEAKGLDGPLPEPLDLYFLGPSDQPGVLGTLGDYEVREVIGQGGMGVVLKAYEPALHRLVAIKVLSPALAGSATARRRFTREAQAAAAVCHDHIVAVHGVHEQAGLPYLVMQYVAGESLQDRLDRTGPLEVTEVVRIGLQTAQALAAAHAQGLIHRDVKPANLLLENGLARVKITDFGLARTADDVGLTRHGVVAGTPEYMAPEQARGEPVDHRADLFSLGSVLYAMCAGRPPFGGSTALAVLRHVTDQTPAPLRSLNPEVPPWLEALVARLMAKDPAGRIPSAAEAAALLEGYLAHLRQPATVAAPVLLPAAPSARPGAAVVRALTRATRFPRRPGPALLVLLAVLGLGALVWALAGQGTDTAGTAAARPRRVYDFRKPLDDLKDLALFGPDVDAVARTDARGLRITLPAGRPDRNNVGVELPGRIGGDFDIEVGYELLEIGDNTPNSAAGVQLRLAFADPSVPLVALARFHNRFPPQRADLFQVVGHDGETFAAYRITLLPDLKEQPEGVDVRAGAPRGRLKLSRRGRRLDYFVSDGGSPFHRIRSEEVGAGDLGTLRLVVFAGWGPVALDVRFTDLVIEAEALPARLNWLKVWRAGAVVAGR